MSQLRWPDRLSGEKCLGYTRTPLSPVLPNIPLSPAWPGWAPHNTISKSHRYFGLYLTLPTLRAHHTRIQSKFPKTSKYPNQTIFSHLISSEMFSF